MEKKNRFKVANTHIPNSGINHELLKEKVVSRMIDIWTQCDELI